MNNRLGLQAIHYPSTMSNRKYTATLLFLLSLRVTEARKWQDVVDRNIYLQPNLDQDRYQLKVELDPFFRADDISDLAPTPQPISSTWVPKTPVPTDSPSAIPSDSPSLAPTGPTSSPTLRSENIEGHGGCRNGTTLYRVNFYDSWGDGWDSSTKLTITGVEDQDSTEISGSTVTKTSTSSTGDTTVSISTTVELTSDHPFGTASTEDGYNYVNPLGKIFEGNLHSGSHGYAYVCLVARRCYEALIRGGDFLDEVSWDIEPVNLGSSNKTSEPVVEGGAPLDCSFSIPDENGDTFCDKSCSRTLHPAQTQVPDVVEHLQTYNPDETVEVTTRSYDLEEAKQNGANLLHIIREGSS